jgi:hypothetical protein
MEKIIEINLGVSEVEEAIFEVLGLEYGPEATSVSWNIGDKHNVLGVKIRQSAADPAPTEDDR